MPIRRAAGTPPQETPPKSNQDGDPDASSEESVSAGEDQEAEAVPPTDPPKEGEESVVPEGGDKEEAAGEAPENEKPPEEPVEDGAAEKEGEKDAGKEKEKEKEKEKVKKVKRTIPSWATISASRRALVQKSSSSLYNQPKMDDILMEAIKACKHKASTYAIRKYILKTYASMELDRRSFLLKKSLKRLLEKGAIKQLKGKGFSGSFSICKQAQKPAGKKPAAAPPVKTETLGDTLPLVMTHLCEPKEASYILIKKYLEQHFPQLNVEQRPDLLKSALQRSVDKGLLEQITGKGASGTFQIRRSTEKPSLKGGQLEEAILTAITAMNEPKTCSTSIMRKFLLEKHKDSRASLLVNNLKRTLKTCKMRGWMEQISGNGFNGTYQLCYPFYPSPALLFPEKHKQKAEAKRKKEIKEESSDEEEEDSDEEEDEDEESEEEESESEDEPPPKRRKQQQKRPPPKVRRPPPAKKSQARSRGGAKQAARAKKPTPAKKRSAPPAKKAAPPSKRKAPAAKRPVPVAKTSAKPAPPSKAAAKKPAAPPAKKPAAPPAKKPAAPPAKKPAAPPAKKPVAPPAKAKAKTPARKMTSRAPKRLTPKRPAPKAAAPTSAVKAKPAARRSRKSRK